MTWNSTGTVNATNTPVSVHGSKGSFVKSVNQSSNPIGTNLAGATWQSLGYVTTEDGMVRVQISNAADGQVIADSVRVAKTNTSVHSSHVEVPSAIQLNDGSADLELLLESEATVDEWQIDWGDGTQTTTQSTGSLVHTYTSVGEYPISVAATGAFGEHNLETKKVVVDSPMGSNALSNGLEVANPSGVEGVFEVASIGDWELKAGSSLEVLRDATLAEGNLLALRPNGARVVAQTIATVPDSEYYFHQNAFFQTNTSSVAGHRVSILISDAETGAVLLSESFSTDGSGTTEVGFPFRTEGNSTSVQFSIDGDASDPNDLNEEDGTTGLEEPTITRVAYVTSESVEIINDNIYLAEQQHDPAWDTLELIFAGTRSDGQVELFKSDGTSSGTRTVANLGGVQSSQPRELTVVRDRLYFVAEYNGEVELHVLTKTGEASRVRNIAGSISSNPHELIEYKDQLFFAVTGNDGDIELHKSDGTSEGTVRVKNLSGITSSEPRDLTIMNDRLYFTAVSTIGERELYVSDGTAPGTYRVHNLGGAAIDANPSDLTVVGDTLYFVASTQSGERELHKSDGTSSGTQLVADIGIGTSSNPSELIEYAGELYFRATDTDGQTELWKSDGTSSGTELVRNLSSTISSNPHDLVVFKDHLYFAATMSNGQVELHRSDGTTDGTRYFVNLHGMIDANPKELTIAGETLFFTAVGGDGERELYTSDGTESGTGRRKDIAGTLSSDPQDLVAVGSTLYFTALMTATERELYRSDGTTTGTYLVKNLGGNPEPHELVPFDLTPATITVVRGSTDLVGTPIDVGGGAMLTLEEDGDLSYDPVTNNTLLHLAPDESIYQTVSFQEIDGTTQTASKKLLVIRIDGVNNAPHAGALRVTDGYVSSGNAFELSLPDAFDIDGEVQSVAFYRDDDGNGELSVADRFLAMDTIPGDGWTHTVDAGSWEGESTIYFAVPSDDAALRGEDLPFAGAPARLDVSSLQAKVSAVAPATDLINNGGFESPVIANATEYLAATSLTGWSIPLGSPDAELIREHTPTGASHYWEDAETAGSQWLELDSLPGLNPLASQVFGRPIPEQPAQTGSSTSVYQDVTVDRNAIYRLEFATGARPDIEFDNFLNVLVLEPDPYIPGAFTVVRDNITYRSRDDAENYKVDWHERAIEFVPQSDTIRIVFSDVGENDEKGTFVDNVRLSELDSQIVINSGLNTITVSEDEQYVEIHAELTSEATLKHDFFIPFRTNALTASALFDYQPLLGESLRIPRGTNKRGCEDTAVSRRRRGTNRIVRGAVRNPLPNVIQL